MMLRTKTRYSQYMQASTVRMRRTKLRRIVAAEFGLTLRSDTALPPKEVNARPIRPYL